MSEAILRLIAWTLAHPGSRWKIEQRPDSGPLADPLRTNHHYVLTLTTPEQRFQSRCAVSGRETAQARDMSFRLAVIFAQLVDGVIRTAEKWMREQAVPNVAGTTGGGCTPSRPAMGTMDPGSATAEEMGQ